jgi:Fe-S-cluster containining protein
MKYDCSKCPGFCCTYELIEVTDADVRRLAKHFDVTERVARKRFTKMIEGTRSLRHKRDTVFPKICRFFDTKARRCTVYSARPGVCRWYPYARSCSYYNWLADERKSQDDPDLVIRASLA